METKYYLTKRDYTIYNALAWGNCLNHYQKAREAPLCSLHRLVHIAIAALELLPVIGQAASLFETAVACCFKPQTTFTDLMQRKIASIPTKEPPLRQRIRAVAPLVPRDSTTLVRFPQAIKDLSKALFFLHRQIERQYQSLPWPQKVEKVVVFTQVEGGRGDVAAAAKAIALMQRICPRLSFDWVLLGARSEQYDPLSFLKSRDPSKVRIRSFSSPPPEDAPGDLLVTGPVKLSWGTDYLQSRIQREIKGAVFGFMENAQESFNNDSEILQIMANEGGGEEGIELVYQRLHPLAFRSESDNNCGLLPMGLQPGSGLFLDRSLLEAPLSRGYCCPSYLKRIQDEEFRTDLLEAMNVFDRRLEPDYDQFSLNMGYAHRRESWGKFIDCVAIHEKNKHPVIVLNQKGEFGRLSTEEFKNQILTPQRLSFLKEKGYGTVVLKGKEEEGFLLLDQPEKGRRLTVIVRDSFSPDDMKRLQLASERLLATGDNSALEAWCSRCKLYLYEDVANAGCKWRFLQQQVDLAESISPNLSKLLALFGGDRRLEEPSLNTPLSREKMGELETLLNDANLSDATLQFCDLITSNYSFHEVFEGALKRAVWHDCMPELARIEAETIDEEFRIGLVNYLKNREGAQKEFHLRNLPELAKRIQQTVTRNK